MSWPSLPSATPRRQAAGARQLLDRLRRVRGDFQDGFVLHDPAARQVALLRRRLAPRRDRLQHAEKPPVGRAAQPEAPPRLVRIGAVDRRIDQILHLFREPAGAAVFAEDLLQPLIDGAQMDHIGQRVCDLPLGQGPLRPIGEARGLVETGAGQPPDQRLVADRVAEAAHHRGDLGIEDRVRHLAGQLKEDFEVLAPGVKHLEDRGIGHQVEQRRQIEAGRERVDRDGLVGSRHLREAQDRPIGALAHELGIDRDELGAFLPGAERRRAPRYR